MIILPTSLQNSKEGNMLSRLPVCGLFERETKRIVPDFELECRKTHVVRIGRADATDVVGMIMSGTAELQSRGTSVA